MFWAKTRSVPDRYGSTAVLEPYCFVKKREPPVVDHHVHIFHYSTWCRNSSINRGVVFSYSRLNWSRNPSHEAMAETLLLGDPKPGELAVKGSRGKHPRNIQQTFQSPPGLRIPVAWGVWQRVLSITSEDVGQES